MKRLFSIITVALFLAIAPASVPAQAPSSHSHFGDVADSALAAMQQRAKDLNIGGVAVVAYFQGDSIQSWESKMVVVGRMKDLPTTGNPGSNLLAIAYAKASEMADTLRDSGSHARPPMTGEFDWTGGVIARSKTGYVIAAFSGGKSDDDVQVSKSGLARLKDDL
ncbi:hypothetical protein HNQ77_001122 [Silvibacterium bohemicum]|uniref:Heme-binding protein n=1 Tax=Silvibacterium bohemicum TaxID=1577686 RepID=A0A841JXL2_9BACT|nr:hypothetical protein [Silvibacterium bohemicum]MBB6143178.1 hypothetical protein [Silvibacterium bohemicum]